MDLLTINDTPGQYPDSWYAHTANHLPVNPTLNDDLSADVCIIGGGYTGLSTALHLAEAGIDCIVLEANRMGWGASGRNGGQVGIGFNKSQDWLEKELGVEAAQGLWQLGLDGAQLVEKLVTEHNIDCDLQSGILYPTHSKREFAEFASEIKRLQANYEASQISVLDKAELKDWHSDWHKPQKLQELAFSKTVAWKKHNCPICDHMYPCPATACKQLVDLSRQITSCLPAMATLMIYKLMSVNGLCRLITTSSRQSHCLRATRNN